MLETRSRNSDSLRRVLFLCADNHHGSRFCEELFNSYARAEGLNWQAASRAVFAGAAARNDGPMSIAAIDCLRRLGTAPVNHLRLPLHATSFDFQMSTAVCALDRKLRPAIERTWPQHAHCVAYWPSPAARGGEGELAHLNRELRGLFVSLQLFGRASPAKLETADRASCRVSGCSEYTGVRH